MIPLQVEAAGAAVAVAFEVEPPGGAADALGKAVERAGRRGCRPPAGPGGAGLGGGGLAEQEARHSALPGAKRQAAAGGEIERPGVPAQLAEDGGKSRTAEALLEDPERFFRPAGLDHHEPGGGQSELVEAGSMGMPALPEGGFLGDAEDRPVVAEGEAREQGRGEAEGGRRLAGGLRPDLVKGVPPEPAAESPVGRGHSERQEPPVPIRRKEGTGGGKGRPGAGGRGLASVFGRGRKARPAFYLGDAAGKPDKGFPRHESASAHGL